MRISIGARHRYADILEKRRPISKRKPMDISHRAKQFAPFSALTGLEDHVHAKELRYVKKPVLSEEKQDEINWKLQMLTCGWDVTVTWFVYVPGACGRGQLCRIEGKVEEYKPHDILQVAQRVIRIKDICDLDGTCFGDEIV